MKSTKESFEAIDKEFSKVDSVQNEKQLNNILLEIIKLLMQMIGILQQKEEVKETTKERDKDKDFVIPTHCQTVNEHAPFFEPKDPAVQKAEIAKSKTKTIEQEQTEQQKTKQKSKSKSMSL